MNRSAPGTYVVERDWSTYVAASGVTSYGCVATAKRGPINKPTLITSPDQFLETFGEPSPSHYGTYSALNYLQFGLNLWFNRVAKQYKQSTVSIQSLGTPDSNGRINSFTAANGHGLIVGTFLKITQTGKASTHNAKVTIVTGNQITLDIPLLDRYDPSGESDSEILISPTSGAATQAEVFALSRRGGEISRIVKFIAKDPGEYANFGTKSGIEIVIQDGGQFSNVNPSTSLPYESNGVPLQGVMPSSPSVDVKAALLKLTATQNGLRIGETRGVNYATETALILGVTLGSGSSTSSGSVEAVLEVTSSQGFSVGSDVLIDGSPSYDGEYQVEEILSGTEILVSGFPAIDETEPDDGEYWTLENLDSPKTGVVFRCTDNDADGSKGYSTWVPQGVLTKRVLVFYQGRQVESFDNMIGFDIESPYYWDKVIGSESSQVSNSNYIYAEYLGSGQQPISTYDRVSFPFNPRLQLGLETSCRIEPTAGSSSTILFNAKGFNGSNPDASDYIGTVSEDGSKSGLEVFRSKYAIEIDILAVPGISLPSVINKMFEVLEARKDCLGIVDPPYRLSRQGILDWHNGTGQYSGYHQAFATDKAALFWGWVQSYDPYTSQNLWLPPSCYLPGQFAYSDSVGEVFFAAAGYRRGRLLGALAVETVIEEGDVEIMYGPANGNAINPIMSFGKDGIMVFGNRTLQRFPSSLDRINVRRMLFSSERYTSRATRTLAFEQNDPIVWGQISNLLQPFFDDYRGRRAIEDFKIVCDETTNLPVYRNQNQFMAKVYVIPTKSGEKIELTYTILPSGVNLDVVVSQDTNL